MPDDLLGDVLKQVSRSFYLSLAVLPRDLREPIGLAYLLARAERCGVRLAWGRDGSVVRVGEGMSRFKAGSLTMPYKPAYVFGRHVVDTYQQIQRYDIGGRLSSYGLKQAVDELGEPRRPRCIGAGGPLARGDRGRLEDRQAADGRDENQNRDDRSGTSGHGCSSWSHGEPAARGLSYAHQVPSVYVDPAEPPGDPAGRSSPGPPRFCMLEPRLDRRAPPGSPA